MQVWDQLSRHFSFDGLVHLHLKWLNELSDKLLSHVKCYGLVINPLPLSSPSVFFLILNELHILIGTFQADVLYSFI